MRRVYSDNSIIPEIPLTESADSTMVQSMNVDLDTAAGLLQQLGNPTRLRIVRLLVPAGHQGMTVGEVQRQLGIPASTLSHHLNHLRAVGLVTQRRERTLLHCSMSYDRIDALIRFLTSECCAREQGESGQAKSA